MNHPISSDLPPILAKAAPKTYGLMAVFAVPALALAIFWIRTPGQEKYGYIVLGIVLFCFVNIAAIRLYFDGRIVRYWSLMKRTRVQMDEVTGAKIGYIEGAGQTSPFFFLSTLKRGDIMLNLPLFSKTDSQEFCRRLTAMGFPPLVAHGFRARLLANSLYPDGLAPEQFEAQE